METKYQNNTKSEIPSKLTKIKSRKPKIKVFSKKKKHSSETDDIEQLKLKYNSIDKDKIKTFKDIPLSERTQKGLKTSGYVKPTQIQLQTIDLSLQGKDILGAAQTGSGKTLAFLIPILELLYCKQWTRLDGLGALVITPTRELAYQIFETLRKIGEYHDFSAGLVIGGKDLKFERKRLDQCNIIICTPGRLLHHMDENPLFECVNLQILVLDEADRCLDLGFERTMNAIIENLPQKRQTLLFSATQTKSVKDLARLSLKDPCYISSYKNSEFSTPDGLEQSYAVCNLADKISIVWSFIKNHSKQKCIIFLASCKQVKYIYEIFCQLRPGVSLLALYGSLHQMRRMEIYETFCSKTSAVLFATDIAARGLDFPKVNWVVQVDCPEDSATYIHRVGRTARYNCGGNSLLMLLPTELALIDDLKSLKISINEIEINPEKLQNPIRKIEAHLARMPSVKDTAKRAFVSYIKSVFLMKNKKIFQVNSLEENLDSYAKSLGLAITPRVRFLQKYNANRKMLYDDDEDDKNDLKKRLENSEQKLTSSLSFHADSKPKHKPFTVSDDSDSDDGILKIKRQDHDIELPSETEILEMDQIMSTKEKKKTLSKVAMAKKVLKKQIVANTKIVFDEEGEAVQMANKERRSELAKEYEQEDAGGIDIERAKLVLKEEDKYDKQIFKEKVKAKHKEEKRKRKEKNRKEEESDKDDFGSGTDEEPDLSWLPDPDKIYSKKNDNEQDVSNNFTSDSDINNDEDISKHITPKRRKVHNEVSKVTNKKSKLMNATSSFTVNEAEELALMLLKNK